MAAAAGVFHVELKYTSRGARLIEVNARMGGGPVRDTNLLVWGVDLVEQQLLASCGIPCCPGVSPEPLMELAELSVNAMVRYELLLQIHTTMHAVNNLHFCDMTDCACQARGYSWTHGWTLPSIAAFLAREEWRAL